MISEKPTLTAILADFSHSLYDTGEERYLVGGTEDYAAPEWKSRATTNQLKLTDVFSYGLVFGSIMAGQDLIQNHDRHKACNAPSLHALKSTGQLIVVLQEKIRTIDDASNMALFEDMEVITDVLKVTLALNPADRNLDQAIAYLSGM